MTKDDLFTVDFGLRLMLVAFEKSDYVIRGDEITIQDPHQFIGKALKVLGVKFEELPDFVVMSRSEYERLAEKALGLDDQSI